MPLIQVQELSIRYPAKPVLQDLSFEIEAGVHCVIQGESGSGKTSLAKAITGQIGYSGSIVIAFDRDSSLPPQTLFVSNWYRFTNLEGDRNFYYQQRYNHQQRRDTLTVQQELEDYAKQQGLDAVLLDTLLTSFEYTGLTDEQLIELSSGEHKKLQLIKALWLSPQLLIIDQPYTGLDAASRATLNRLFDAYSQKGGTLLLLSNDIERPGCIHRIITLKDGVLIEGIDDSVNQKKTLPPLPPFLKEPPQYSSSTLIRMRDVGVHYEEKQVLSQINWQVNAGERWLLQGHNGSGKSTLLSLITGDHPQAYANDIQLFGVQRGGGESIWDIKKKIGLISPELHWYFDANATVSQTVASGFFDSNGQYRPLRYAQKQQLETLLRFLNLQAFAGDLLTTLPLGKQRLALLGRTLIKNPQLLILDEPCQGLDQQQTQYFNDLVDAISENGVTMVYVGHFESQLPRCLTHRLVLEKGGIQRI